MLVVNDMALGARQEFEHGEVLKLLHYDVILVPT